LGFLFLSIKFTFIFLNLFTSHFSQGTDKHNSVSHSVSVLCSKTTGFIIKIVLYVSASQLFGNHTAMSLIDCPICGAARPIAEFSLLFK
jgi:hypothetical protein